MSPPNSRPLNNSTHSAHRERDRVARDSATIMIATGAGLTVMVATDFALAYRFGLNRTTDALVVALALPLALDAILREASKFSLVPLLIERFSTATPAESARYFSALINATLVAAVALVAALEMAAKFLPAALAPGFNAADLSTLISLLAISLPLIGISALNNVLAAVLQARQQFFAPAMRQAIVGTTVLAAISYSVSYPPQQALKLVGASYTLGYCFHFILLALLSAEFGRSYSPRSWLDAGQRRMIGKRLSWTIVTFALPQSMRVAERSIATALMPGGVITYHLAFRLYAAAQLVLAWSLSTAGLSPLARSVATETIVEFAGRVRRLAGQGLALTAPGALLITIAAAPLASLITAMSGAEPGLQTEMSGVLRALALALPLGTLGILLSTALYALGKPLPVLGYTAVAVAVNLLLALTLAPSFGITALGWALVAATTMTSLGAAISLVRAGVQLISPRTRLGG